MENYPNEETQNQKLLYDVNNNDITIENDYCPHIFDHFLNNYLNSKLKKINISKVKTKNQSSPTENEKKHDKHLIYFPNLSIIQNSFKTFNYYGYGQAKNILNSFLVRNISSDFFLLSNPQNVSLNSMNKEGCVFAMNFNDTGNLLGSSNHHNTIEIWDMKEKKVKKVINSHTEIVTGIEFFHKKEDNDYFITCSLDKTIKLWKNYMNIHTFLEHSDWVRCISIREDNARFLSGCVSSVVKLWDIPTQRVIGSIINQTSDTTSLTTVNSLNFFNNDPNLFLIGLRSGEVKLCDSRIQNKNDNFIKNVGIVHSFKAHKNKLNTIKINNNDKYMLTSGRDSLLRLWDIRKIPKNEENPICVNEYNKHKCVGYNIECNFYLNENYLMTGSEDGNILIYDIINPNIYYKFKTSLKCINLIKQIPNTSSIAYTGLEDISIFVWSAHKNISKFYEKYCYKLNNKNNENFEYESDSEEDLDLEVPDKSAQDCNKFIEEIMTECGDVILKLFHTHNLTYSNGINLEKINEIIQNNKDEKTAGILHNITNKFIKKMMENLINSSEKKKNKEKKKEKKIEKKKNIKTNEIKCLECTNKNNKKIENDNNIFNSVDRELLSDLLILPNNYNFNKENEIK